MRSATRYRVKTSYTLTAQRHQIFLDGKTCARSTVHQLSSLLQGVPSSCLQSITGLWHSAFLINPTTPRAALACHTFAAKCLDATSLQGLSWNCIWPLLPLCPNPGRNTVYNWGWEAEWKLRSLLFLCNLVYLAPPTFVIFWTIPSWIEYNCDHSSVAVSKKIGHLHLSLLTVSVRWLFRAQTLGWEELGWGSPDTGDSSATASQKHITSQLNEITHSSLLLLGFPWAIGVQHFWNSDPWNQVSQSSFVCSTQSAALIKG